ncbi:MAG: tail fiber domain-containing protein [Phycisphaerae bacterium]
MVSPVATRLAIRATSKESSILIDTSTFSVSGNSNLDGNLTIGDSITIDGIADTITATGGKISFDNENLVTTGKIAIGTLSDSIAFPLAVLGTDRAALFQATSSTAGTPVKVASIRAATTGTAIAGFGARLKWDVESDNGIISDQVGTVDVLWTNPTFPGSSDMVFGLRDDALVAERMRLTSQGNLEVVGTITSGGSITIDGGANSINSTADLDLQTAGTSRIFLDNTTGNVGIGRTPTTNDLEVEGTASKTTSGSWLANSDRRIKRNVEAISDALSKLDKVRLVSFKYTDQYRAEHPSIEDRRYLNVIAQEFEEVFPEYVKRSGDKLPSGEEILQVDPWPVTIYSAAAVQELHAVVKKQQGHIAELEGRLSALEAILGAQARVTEGGVQ